MRSEEEIGALSASTGEAASLGTSSPPSVLGFRLTFTHGFLVGQASMILLAILFVRYVVFEDANAALETDRKRRKARARKASRRARAASNPRPPKTFVPDILSKLGFDVDHPPESADWLNVLIAQALVAYRGLLHGEGLELEVEASSREKAERARLTVEEALNYGRADAAQGFVGLDCISVTEVDFGESFPVCSNAVVRPADETGRMRVEVDVDYSDHVTLVVDTNIVINFPRPRFAVLPVSLGLTLNTFHGTVMAEIPPSVIPFPDRTSGTPSPAILLSLDPDFTLTMSTSSLLGSRAKLQDIPKVEQLILGRIRGWIADNLVWPKVRILRLPGLGKKGNVEEADGEGEYVWIEGVPMKKPAAESMRSETEDASTSTDSPTRRASPMGDSSTSAEADEPFPGFVDHSAFESTPVGSARQLANTAGPTRPRKPSFGAHLGQGVGVSIPRSFPRESFDDNGPADRLWASMYSPPGSPYDNGRTQWARSGGMASVGLGRTGSESGTSPFHLRERMQRREFERAGASFSAESR